MRLMQRLGLVSCAVMLATLATADTTKAVGVVFHDQDLDGLRGEDEPGVPNVLVSNGCEVVSTDAQGRYEIAIDDDEIIFVIKPRSWRTRIDEYNKPSFYYIHKPGGSPKQYYPGVEPTGPLPASVDFALYPQEENEKFDVVVFGDTQPTSIEEVCYLGNDIVAPAVGSPAVFGFTLGDIAGDRPDLHMPVVETIAQMRVPWYYVLGNHDENYDSADDTYSTESFQRVFGPPYYSFNYADAHFIVLDDIVWHGKTEEKRGHYTCGLGARQMEFLHNDLKRVDKDTLVVLTMHIPIIDIDAAERKELYDLLAAFPYTLSLSAHTHINAHGFLDESLGWPGRTPHHHMNVVTTCGSWWTGAPDEEGIPHTTMRDGAPNGWVLLSIDGHDYTSRFQAARRPADYQMTIYAPNEVFTGEVGRTEVIANVFDGSTRSKVQMRVDGCAWAKMKQEPREDPFYVAMKQAEGSETPPNGKKLPKPIKSPHIWVGKLPAGLKAGVYEIEVRTVDQYGHEYRGRRLIRVVGEAAVVE